MGGRGASSSKIPTAIPAGGGRGDNKMMDLMPGSPNTLSEALGEKGKPMSDAKAVMNANPFYDGSYGEYSENCQRAVVATEGRFRGYDIVAQPTYNGDTMPYGSNYARNFKNAKVEYIGKSSASETQKSLEARMQEYGNGSRAILAVTWKNGSGGHVINVVQKNGRTYYYDGQVGKKYDGAKLFSVTKPKQTELVRVDNLEFSTQAKEAVRQNPFKKK